MTNFDFVAYKHYVSQINDLACHKYQQLYYSKHKP